MVVIEIILGLEIYEKDIKSISYSSILQLTLGLVLTVTLYFKAIIFELT